MNAQTKTDDQLDAKPLAVTEMRGPTGIVAPEFAKALAARGMSETDGRVLQESIFPGAKPRSIILGVDYCRARKLDVFKKPIHIVQIWDKKNRELVDTIWPGIYELRTTASRTGEYAGKSEPEFGPYIGTEFEGGVKIRHPEWCKITVYRIIAGHKCEFTAKVHWLEAYAEKGKTDVPNSMWQKRVHDQLAKCTEAEALREAFPEETGGIHIDAEARDMRDITPPQPTREAVAEEMAQEAESAPQEAVDDAGGDDEPETEPEATEDGGEQAEVRYYHVIDHDGGMSATESPSEYADWMIAEIEKSAGIDQLKGLRESNLDDLKALRPEGHGEHADRINAAIKAKQAGFKK